jgi:hypothetical protein
MTQPTSVIAVPTKDSRHPWSVSDFETRRNHLTMWVRLEILPFLEDPGCSRILVRAPVKSGKREIVEYIAMRDYSPQPHRVHVFLSAWHRVADDEQRGELSKHNVHVFSMTAKLKAEECIRWVNARLVEGKQVVIHIDECDFGAGDRQIMGRVYTRFRENNSCTFILYSATPQEVIFSGEVDEKGEEEFDELVEEIRQTGKSVEYTPPEGYCGPAKFLEENLIFDAMPFFHSEAGSIRLSTQGAQIVAEFRANPSRNIMILRLSGADGKQKENKHIYQFLRGASRCKELDGIGIIAAKEKDEGYGRFERVTTGVIEWSNREYWLNFGRPMIIVIDQTASRSTELVCHDRIFAYHDYRNTVVYTTVSQAQERVNHYAQKYGGFQRIRIYGHKKTFQLSAGLISYGEYMESEWTKKKVSNQEAYHIKNKAGEIHANYPDAMTSDAADRALQEIGCFAQVKVSDRVRGRSKIVPVFGCEFHSCTTETFAALGLSKRFDHTFDNPFLSSLAKGMQDGRMQGYLREWGVFEFEYVESNRGWGMTGPKNTVRLTICYRQGQLGVAVRWNTGEKEEINTLQTFKSMYHH